MSTYLIERNFGAGKLNANASPRSFLGGKTILHVMRKAWALWERAEDRLESWSARRQLLGANEDLLKDLGVSRCGVEWAVRNGRDNDRAG
jgi:uncharacterized protein YjiS (DUF1127 family)